MRGAPSNVDHNVLHPTLNVRSSRRRTGLSAQENRIIKRPLHITLVVLTALYTLTSCSSTEPEHDNAKSIRARAVPFLGVGHHILAGRSSTTRHPLSDARKVYADRLASIVPGMTRRQLYAVLPPRMTPTAHPSRLEAIIGVPQFTPHTELHPLDENFSLVVTYRLARMREYPLPPLAPGNKRALNLEALLTKREEQVCPSRENPRDIIRERPALIGGGFESHFFIMPFNYGEMQPEKKGSTKQALR